MNQITTILQNQWEKIVAISPLFAAAIIILLVSYIVGRMLGKFVENVLKRSGLRKLHETFFRRVTISIALFIGLVIALNILGLERIAASVLAGGGVTAIVLGFAFREIGENFLAGLFLAFSRPFNVGDIIKSEDFEGQVREIELRNTHIRTDDGQDVYIPNSQLFNRPVTNYTKDGLRRLSFTVGIDYSNDAKSGCQVVLRAISDLEGVLEKPEPEVHIFLLGPQYVELQVSFWVDIFDRKLSMKAIRDEVMNRVRITLLEKGFIISSETTTNIAITKGGTKPSINV